jgi:uncharacterized protein
MLHVENVTRGCVLVEQGRLANNEWTRFKGLMGERHLPAGDGMLITPCGSVHCMWMRIPIDVIYLDKADRIVGIDQALKPWRIGHFYRGAHHVLELPAGTAAATGTQVGDQLKVDL